MNWWELIGLVGRWFSGEMMGFTLEVGLGRRGPDGH